MNIIINIQNHQNIYHIQTYRMLILQTRIKISKFKGCLKKQITVKLNAIPYKLHI